MSEQFKDMLAWVVIALAGFVVVAALFTIAPIAAAVVCAAVILGWALDRLCL